MKYSIIIPTYNHCDDLLKPCIASVLANIPKQDTEIIVVANGCTDNTKEYLLSLEDQVKTVWHDNALGYPKAINAGLEISQGDYVILLNNDTVVLAQHWIDKMIEPFADETVGITGPLISYSSETERDFLIFFCVMIRRSVFAKIGTLNEMFTPGYADDMEFCWRAQTAGYRILEVDAEGKQLPQGSSHWVTPFPIYHRGTATMDYKGGIVERNSSMLRDLYKSRKPL